MTPQDQKFPPDTAMGAQFAATSWTNVIAAQQSGSPEAAAALEKLCLS
jgi:hypothetical protein